MTCTWEGQLDSSFSEGIINGSLEKVSGKDKDQGGQWVTLAYSRTAMKLSARNPVKQHRRSASGKNTINPRQPFVVEAHVFHDVKHGGMLDHVESFGEIQLKKNNLSLRGLTLMNVLEGPGEIVLDRAPFDETVLVFMNYLQDDTL